MNTIRRTIHPQTKVLDESKGLVEYVASDESLDAHREVIRASGWRFNRFAKNAPFVDSHRYDSMEDLLGRVVDFKVERGRLIETVQWAIDVEGNRLARLGFDMTRAGYARAVSVGFLPVRAVSRYSDPQAYQLELQDLGKSDSDGVQTIYLEQEQIELSAVIIGANPAALAKGYAAGVLDDADLEHLHPLSLSRVSAARGTGADAAEACQHRSPLSHELFARALSVIANT